jgi:hypothetical protein
MIELVLTYINKEEIKAKKQLKTKKVISVIQMDLKELTKGFNYNFKI